MPLRKNRIPQTRAAITAAAAQGVHRAAEYVRDLAQQLCPVDTGALRQSIRIEPASPALRMVVRAGGGVVTYAAFVEYGTPISPAQPFLTPAADAISVRREVLTAIRKVLR